MTNINDRQLSLTLITDAGHSRQSLTLVNTRGMTRGSYDILGDQNRELRSQSASFAFSPGTQLLTDTQSKNGSIRSGELPA